MGALTLTSHLDRRRRLGSELRYGNSKGRYDSQLIWRFAVVVVNKTHYQNVSSRKDSSNCATSSKLDFIHFANSQSPMKSVFLRGEPRSFWISGGACRQPKTLKSP